jgi:transposase
MSLNSILAGSPSPAPVVSPPQQQPPSPSQVAVVLGCECGCVTRRPRYPSDLSDAQWQVLEPLLPPLAGTGGRVGRPETHHRRAIIDAILYLVDNGIRWRAMPADFPPWRTVYGLFSRWAANLRDNGTIEIIEIAADLREQLRTRLGRTPTPTAGIIDSQSVKESADAVVPQATSGYDSFKNVNGRKRHILVDTCGLLCAVVATPANIRDPYPATDLLAAASHLGITRVWADQGYHVNALIDHAHQHHNIDLIIVRRPKGRNGFIVLTRRWVVERTFAWLTRRRRCARDYERLPGHHEAMIWWAAILTMTRRLTQNNN